MISYELGSIIAQIQKVWKLPDLETKKKKLLKSQAKIYHIRVYIYAYYWMIYNSI